MEEILAWFDMQNCVNTHTNKFQYPDGTIVADAHEGNIIKDSSNALFPIDLHIEKWVVMW
ncbi:MAG: hypothetical protein JWL81_1757 [Verrucomicrobiales bacterium]|nr:hypothetical protein [Verrucomicrobiales bacterium]